MEGLIGLLVLGWCIWFAIRHPLRSLNFIFKILFLLMLGLGGFLTIYWFLLTSF